MRIKESPVLSKWKPSLSAQSKKKAELELELERIGKRLNDARLRHEDSVRLNLHADKIYSAKKRLSSLTGHYKRKSSQLRAIGKTIELIKSDTTNAVERVTIKQKKEFDYHRSVKAEIKQHDQILLNKIILDKRSYKPMSEVDVFISHASEDKDDFVRGLADDLSSLGINVWFDEYTLTIGDSLRKSIDIGLSNCKFGIVVLSTSFFRKNWTQYELNGLIQKEMEGKKVVLPIWHKVTKDEVQKFSPSLADKVALNSSILNSFEIAKAICEAVEYA